MRRLPTTTRQRLSLKGIRKVAAVEAAAASECNSQIRLASSNLLRRLQHQHRSSIEQISHLRALSGIIHPPSCQALQCSHQPNRLCVRRLRTSGILIPKIYLGQRKQLTPPRLRSFKAISSRSTLTRRICSPKEENNNYSSSKGYALATRTVGSSRTLNPHR